MTSDESLYRRYLGGNDDGLTGLMERYGDKLTLYLDGYLRDIHEAEDLMIEVFAYLVARRPAIRDGGGMASVRPFTTDDRGIRHHQIWISEYATAAEKIDGLRRLADEGGIALRVARTFPAEEHSF